MGPKTLNPKTQNPEPGVPKWDPAFGNYPLNPKTLNPEPGVPKWDPAFGNYPNWVIKMERLPRSKGLSSPGLEGLPIKSN